MEKKYHETHATNPLTQITNPDFWYPLTEKNQQLIANHREKRMVNNKDKSLGCSKTCSHPNNACIIAGIDAALVALKAGGARGRVSVGQDAGQAQVESLLTSNISQPSNGSGGDCGG